MTHMLKFVLVAMLVATVCMPGCPPLSPNPEPVVVCPQCPAPKPPPESARYQESTFEALPGWPSQGLTQSLRAFRASCPRSGALSRVCEAAAAVPPDDEQAARQFFESAFIPYALLSSDGADSGLITGYYEPIIEGSRTQTEQHRFPIFGVPEDLVVVDLGATNPELRNTRLRGRI